MLRTYASGTFQQSINYVGDPAGFFNALNKKYRFKTDVCAIQENAKCKNDYTPEVDGLKKSWEGVCWMNPPYGRDYTHKWVQKAYTETRKKKCTVVALLPARTDTMWFHEYIYNKQCVTITFIKGRLKFGNAKSAAPFPSMLVEFKKGA